LQGIDRIDKIVENLIVFSKPVVLQTSKCNFPDLIHRAIENVKEEFKIDENKYAFSLHLPQKEIFLNLDSPLMLQALQNILQNSVEFMPEGGEIKIALVEKQRTNKVVLCVADAGRGLAESNEEKLFYPFFTTKINGMGLGLPTSRLIVEKHGGKIYLKENQHGITVTINLPGGR